MLVCLLICSCKFLKHSSDVLIHGFHIRVIVVSHFSQCFDAILKVAEVIF